MCGQMRTFLDQTGGLWQKNALVGMVIIGLPYSFSGQTTTSEICGCSPYGASTIAGGRNEREVSDIEKQGAYFFKENMWL